jgi:hypothetical protein
MISLAIAFAIGLALGALIATPVAYDRGISRTNRQWLDEKNLDWKRVTIIKAQEQSHP